MLCNECDRPMRPQRTSREEYPGTIVQSVGGTCHSCYQRARRLEATEAPDLTADELCRLPGDVRAWLTERRRRLQTV